VVGVEDRSIVKVTNNSFARNTDIVCTESPLSLSVIFDDTEHSLGLLMRTPGDDLNLIRGLLYSEGIISSNSEIEEIESYLNTYKVILSKNSIFNPDKHIRKLTMTSSCGICGKDSISNLLHLHGPRLSNDIFIDMKIISNAIKSLKKGQVMFSETGGTHACARLDKDGILLHLSEDVGRHNAMDKLIGNALVNNKIPINNEIVIVSGRCSFELIQKSLRAGFPIILALGAPTSLAVDIAMEHGMTLACFVKENKITVFSGSRRIIHRQ
tara:strand:+ start:11043 stop:11849 length:807 start_codon:yes stop_codon:yes gene_type:complete